MIKRILKKLFIVFVSILALLLIGGSLYQFISTKIDDAKYPPPGKMVDVGGYSLHIYCTGSGSPTVILDAGGGNSSFDWDQVQPGIAKFTRVCSFDRAGNGWSDESPNPRTSKYMVEELHTLLKNSETPGPYILVGHSLGGANARLYASQYPDEVAGIVLVDASHEDQLEKIPQLPEQTWLKALRMFPRFLASTSVVRLLNQFHQTPNNPNNPFDNESLKLAKRSTTKYIVTTMQEYKEFPESLKQLKASGGMLDDKPLIVITAGKVLTPKETGYSQKFIDEQTQAWQALQKDLVTKSTQGRQIIAENSDHDIPREQPQIIIDAVQELTKEIRNSIYEDL